MAKFEYRFPELGEGLHEGEIVKMYIKPGDKVTDDDTIMDVQNDKAIVEVPCPVNGTILEVRVKDSQICHVGEIVAIIDVEGEMPEQDKLTKAEEAPTEEPPAAGHLTEAHVAPALNRDVLATPSVRKLARDFGVNINEVTATGKNGKVTRQDVEAFANGGSLATKQEEAPAVEKGATTPATAVTDSRVEEERVPFKGMRKAISNAMVKSAYTAPHVTIIDEVEVSELVAFRTRLKPIMEQKGIKVTYLPFVVKALIAACRQFPVMNAMIDEANNEIVYKKNYNIGIATDTDNGLLVPVIHHADRRSIWMIASDIKDLATRGREGKLSPHEMKGSTITITNIGSAGGMFFTPILNFPEVAILGIGRISEKPVVKNSDIVVASVMALSLSFDHRLIDGATAQNFMNNIKQLLASPERLVMEV